MPIPPPPRKRLPHLKPRMTLPCRKPCANFICAWADKNYGLVDSIGATTELDTAAFLTQNGNPADVAIEITWWFVTFAWTRGART